MTITGIIAISILVAGLTDITNSCVYVPSPLSFKRIIWNYPYYVSDTRHKVLRRETAATCATEGMTDRLTEAQLYEVRNLCRRLGLVTNWLAEYAEDNTYWFISPNENAAGDESQLEYRTIFGWDGKCSLDNHFSSLNYRARVICYRESDDVRPTNAPTTTSTILPPTGPATGSQTTNLTTDGGGMIVTTLPPMSGDEPPPVIVVDHASGPLKLPMAALFVNLIVIISYHFLKW